MVWASERGESRPWGWKVHAERKGMDGSPVVLTVERWVLRWLDSFLPCLLELFHGLLLISWVFYSRGSSQVTPPRHRNLILSSVALGPLVSFPLPVFDFMCKNTDICEARAAASIVTVKRDLHRYRKFTLLFENPHLSTTQVPLWIVS